MSERSFRERLEATFDDGPLDDSELAKDIAETVPGVNRAARARDWFAERRKRREGTQETLP